MAAGVRIFFVDGGGEHADGAKKQLAILGGGLLQGLHVLFDLTGHVVERFGQLADLRGSADVDALVEFGAADRGGGLDQPADWPGNSHGEHVAQNDGCQGNDEDEAHRLGGQFLYSGINARRAQTALRDDRPAQLGDGAVRSDHFPRVALAPGVFGEANVGGGAQLHRQLFKPCHHRRSVGYVHARHKVARLGMGHDVAVNVDHEVGAIAHAGVFQQIDNLVQRNHHGQHPRELAVVDQRHGYYQSGIVVLAHRERLADGIELLHAALERPL